MVQDLGAAAGSHGDLNPIETRACLTTTRTDRPHLPGWKGIAVYRLVAVEFRSRDELLNAVHTEREREVGVAELALEATLLLPLGALTAAREELGRKQFLVLREVLLRAEVVRGEASVARAALRAEATAWIVIPLCRVTLVLPGWPPCGRSVPARGWWRISGCGRR